MLGFDLSRCSRFSLCETRCLTHTGLPQGKVLLGFSSLLNSNYPTAGKKTNQLSSQKEACRVNKE